MSTFNNIQDIFYSGSHAFNGSNDPINEIAFLVDEDYLSYTTVSIAEKGKFLTLLKDYKNVKDSENAAGGGRSHIALKILTGEFLKEYRQQECRYELPLCGYFPDVLSEDKTIVGECGHTQNPEKMLAYFAQGDIQECIQVPYPDESDKIILGYSFVANEGLKEFLEFLAEKKRNDIKSIMQRRRPRGETK